MFCKIFNWKIVFSAVCAISITGVFDPALLFAAAPKGSVNLSSDKMFQTKVGSKTYTCGNLPPWSPGRITSAAFYPAKVELSAVKLAAKKTRSASSKRSLNSKAASLAKYLTAGKAVCKSGTPGSSPTPTPTATPPSSGNSFFDSSGRVTTAGKVAFGIPSSFSASVNSGISAWQHKCASCHGSQAGVLRISTYGPMKARVQLAPMLFTVPGELSEQQIADIVAYANF